MRRVWGSIAVACLFAGPALAQPDYDFQWATIKSPGNAPYQSTDPDNPNNADGRGSVPHAYRMSKLEVTTAQWLEFTNTFSTQTDQFAFTKFGPLYWGAEADPTWGGPGTRYRLKNLPEAANFPVTAITWRDAARFCNWLQNGKSSSLDSLVTGAYDTTTFGVDASGNITDAPTHLPGAKFWIPTYDEWIKAAFFDPDRYGTAQPGWWQYLNSADGPGVSGPPGVGTTSAGWGDPNIQSGEWQIPLGAYAPHVSPWGLLDTSGAASEWTEEFVRNERIYQGSAAGAFQNLAYVDEIGRRVSGDVDDRLSEVGLRIASSVPCPGGLVGIGFVLVTGFFRRNKQ